MEERREGLRAQAPASADSQTAVLRRASDPAALSFLWELKVGRVITLAPFLEEEEWDELEETV